MADGFGDCGYFLCYADCGCYASNDFAIFQWYSLSSESDGNAVRYRAACRRFDTGRVESKIRKSILLIIGYFGLGMSLALCGALPSTYFVTYAVLTMIQGLVVPLYTGPFTALLQTQFAPSYLGRIFSLYGSISQFPSVIGLLLTGFIADRLGVENIFTIGGIAISITGILLLCSASVRNLERKDSSTF